MNKIKLVFFLFLILFLHVKTYSSEHSIVDQNGCFQHPKFQEQANIKDYSLYTAAIEDRIGFWENCAKEVDWFQGWEKTLSWNCPYAKWYLGGKLNISYNCLDRHLKTNPNKIAFIWCNEKGEEKKVSYKEMSEEVSKLANGLKSLGVKKGDIVAIYMPMTPEGIASMLACARIGAVHSVVFGGTGAGSFKEKVNDANAKVIITADVTYRRGKAISLQETVDKIINDCPSVNNVIVLNRENSDKKYLKNPKYIDYKKLLDKSANYCPPEVMDAEDMLFVLYTSGTTGKPKGIVHTTGGYLVGVHNTFKWVFDHKPDDIFWCTADIGWITGHSYVVYGPMSNGATQIIYEGTFDYPEKDIAWKIVEKYKANVFYTAPTLIRTFMKWGVEWIKNNDISSLRLLGSIGEPLNPEAWEWYHKYIGNEKCPIVDTWFQTETGALVISPIPGLTPLKPGSITNPLPGFEAGIYNDEGKQVEHGFLAINSPFPSMMRGLLNDPKRYYDTYWAKWNGSFYYAGDDAAIDEDLYFWCRGRADEVIKISGHRIGTAETENVIVGFPGVAEAAVIGLYDEIKGQKIVAFVVLKEGMTESEQLEEQIKKHVANYMGKYAEPEKIVFIKDLPKTRSGKILRRIIANLIDGKEVGDTTTLVNPDIIDELVFKCDQLNNYGI
ncbi:MAG: acetate--CoA ligase [Parachlamydiales bacterium]